MPRDARVVLYVGIKNCVVALDEKTGAELWRTELGGSDYVTVLWDGEALFAANHGEVWRVDPESGAVIWRNQLKGLGRGVVGLASSRRPTASTDSSQAAAKRRSDAQHAAAAGAAG